MGAFLLLALLEDVGIQVPAGIPVGWTQPIFQATSTQTKRRIENPTRNAKALAMFPFLGLGFSLPSDGGVPRIM
jgi:hypothetical protein